MTPVDFVVVSYGLAVSPLDEDNEAVALDMTRHGFGARRDHARRSKWRARQAIVLNGFQIRLRRAGRGARAIRAASRGCKFVRGNVTQIMLSQPREVLREQGPELFAGILPHYDPMPVLRRLETPQLWILGADDIDAPVGGDGAPPARR